MSRRRITTLIIFVALAGLAATIRYDMGVLAWRQGNNRLYADDNRGALTALSKATDVMPHTPGLSFNKGVALYRLGKYREAQGRFSSASSTTEPGLHASALYNLGNCAFRRGELLAATDRREANRLFQLAASQYRKVIAIVPGSSDARHNLDLARTRLAVGSDEKGKSSRGGRRTPGSGRNDTRGAAQGKPGRSGQPDGKPSSARQTGSAGKVSSRSGGDGPGSLPITGKKPPELTRDEAIRLLNEARGRETLSATYSGGAGGGRSSRPEKDW